MANFQEKISEKIFSLVEEKGLPDKWYLGGPYGNYIYALYGKSGYRVVTAGWSWSDGALAAIWKIGHAAQEAIAAGVSQEDFARQNASWSY